MKANALRHYLICILFCLLSTMSYAETIAIGGPARVIIPANDVMTTRIQQAIMQAPSLAELSVTVTVQNGIVYLAGIIPTTDQAILLVQIVASVKDVQDVFVNRLRVAQNSRNLYDSLITARVQGSIVRQKIFGENVAIKNIPITIKTNQGIVFLSGEVDNRHQLDAIVSLIQSMRSVPRVISMLTLKPYTVRMN